MVHCPGETGRESYGQSSGVEGKPHQKSKSDDVCFFISEHSIFFHSILSPCFFFCEREATLPVFRKDLLTEGSCKGFILQPLLSLISLALPIAKHVLFPIGIVVRAGRQWCKFDLIALALTPRRTLVAMETFQWMFHPARANTCLFTLVCYPPPKFHSPFPTTS